MSNSIKTIQDNNMMEVYENDIYILCDDFISRLDDPQAIYSNKRLVPDMLKYVYRNYVCNILNNKNTNGNRYNIFQLDTLFQITQNIAHKYNCNMTILLFTCICNINRDTINNWKNKTDRELTPEEFDIVKKWFQSCELDLVQGSSVMDIFLLKSNFFYNDQLGALPLEMQGRTQTIEQLPNLAIESK